MQLGTSQHLTKVLFQQCLKYEAKLTGLPNDKQNHAAQKRLPVALKLT